MTLNTATKLTTKMMLTTTKTMLRSSRKQQQTLQTATGQRQKPAMRAPTDSNGASDRASRQQAKHSYRHDADYYNDAKNYQDNAKKQ